MTGVIAARTVLASAGPRGQFQEQLLVIVIVQGAIQRGQQRTKSLYKKTSRLLVVSCCLVYNKRLLGHAVWPSLLSRRLQKIFLCDTCVSRRIFTCTTIARLSLVAVLDADSFTQRFS